MSTDRHFDFSTRTDYTPEGKAKQGESCLGQKSIWRQKKRLSHDVLKWYLVLLKVNIGSFRGSDSQQSQSFGKHITISAYLFFLTVHSAQNSVSAFHSKQKEAVEQWHSTAKTALFSRVPQCQNSPKSHLFQKLKNTLIFRWHYDTVLSLQMLILPISNPKRHQFFMKIQGFYNFHRIK